MAYILLVEDDTLSQEMMQDILEAYDHEVELVASGEDCLASIAERMPEIILLDMNLPDMSGQQIFEKLKAEQANRDIFIIGLSGSGREKQELLAAGLDGYFEKPVQMKELIALIANRS